VGRQRRRFFVPIPKVKSLADLNRRLEEADRRDLARHIGSRRQTVGAMGEADRAALAPLPGEPFDFARITPVRVDRKARVCVRQCFYSVPARFAGRQLQARIGGTRIEVAEGGTLVASHERSTVRGSQTLVLDHYLEILSRKPGAMPGALATRQARERGVLTAAHEAFWARARRTWGANAGGTRALIEVLLLHRGLPFPAVHAALEAVNGAGSADPALVAIEARRISGGRRPTGSTMTAASTCAGSTGTPRCSRSYDLLPVSRPYRAGGGCEPQRRRAGPPWRPVPPGDGAGMRCRSRLVGGPRTARSGDRAGPGRG